jgi:phage-related minor tail protein
MASGRIKGITIEIDGDTKKLSDSLSEVDKSLRQTQTNLKDVNKLLKLDPKNTELLNQKQELLKKALADSKKEVLELNKTLGQMGERNDTNADAYDRIQREIIECQQQQKKWNDELDAMAPKTVTIQDRLQGISDATGKAAEATKGLSTAAGAAAVGLVGMATKAAADADDLLTLANQTGFTVEELQKMQYASSFIDVSMESMTGSITKLTKNMASGSDVFDQLGISITDADGNMRSAIDVWYESVDALGKVANETERDQLSMALFGKSAMEMAGVVDDGGAALKALGDEAESTGLILSQDAVESAVAFNDQIDKLKNTATQAFFSAGSALAETLVPALEKLVTIIVDVLSWFGNLDGSTQAFILTVLALVAAISPILGLISTLTAAAAALNVAMLPMIGTIAGIIAIIAVVVAAGVALYQNWDKIKAAALVLWQNIQTAFNNIRNTITTVFQNVMATVTSISNNIRGTISSIFGSIPGIISGAISGVVGIVSGVFSSVQSTISSAINGARDTVSSAISAIKGAFNFSWSLPPLRLPHISINGSFSLNPPRVPSFGISWYKKAYENAILFSRPTVLPTLGGMKGFGDGNGSEMVIGTNKLLEMMGKAGGTDIDINIYTQPGMNETAIANAVAVKLDRWFGERL